MADYFMGKESLVCPTGPPETEQGNGVMMGARIPPALSGIHPINRTRVVPKVMIRLHPTLSYHLASVQAAFRNFQMVFR